MSTPPTPPPPPRRPWEPVDYIVAALAFAVLSVMLSAAGKSELSADEAKLVAVAVGSLITLVTIYVGRRLPKG